MNRCLNISLFLCLLTFFGKSQVSTSGCYLSGALLNPTNTAGCGNGAGYCDLASLYVPAYSPTACSNSVTSGGVSHAKATSYVLPAGCTATVQAEYQKRNYLGVGSTSIGCSNSGMDGSGDSFSITASGGTIASQSSTIAVNVSTCTAYPTLATYTTAVASLTTGCSNADGALEMVLTGGTVTIAGNSNRADEIITYTLTMSGTCGPSCNLVLPIELISFYAEADHGVVHLTWKIASEKDVDHYRLEKSMDGNQFISIGTVKSKGDSYSDRKYSFTDDFPEKGLIYYRLTNVDEDGIIGNSTLLALNYELDEKDIWLKQDDQNMYLFFNETMQKETMQLINMAGKVVREFDFENSSGVFVLPIDDLHGLYILQSIEGIKPVNVKVVLQ